jgi:signal transduction histidine kinase
MPGEVVGKSVHEVYSHNPRIIEHFNRALAGEEFVAIDEEAGFVYETRWTPIRNYDGEVIRLIGISVDVTESKQAEDELQRHRDHLEELVAERTQALETAQEQLIHQERLAVLGQLAGSVGHELRNPLGVITNAIFYLKLVQRDVTPKVAEYLALIENNAKDATRIISDLIDFATIQTAQRQPTAIVDMVTAVISQLPPPEAVQIEVDIPKNLPLVNVDRNQIKQVITNLVTNAYQAMPEGGRLMVTSEDASNRVLLTITDTGIGIPPEHLEKIFKPLFTTKTTGIGLGLAFSKKLIDINDGAIKVESQPGKGTSFTLWLPI